MDKTPWDMELNEKFGWDAIKGNPHFKNIVRACNAHAALIEALERLLQHDSGCVINGSLETPDCCAYCRAQRALALARGEAVPNA